MYICISVLVFCVCSNVARGATVGQRVNTRYNSETRNKGGPAALASAATEIDIKLPVS